jgi:small subunit ribosomal protein S21
LQVVVRDNNVDQALKVLKKKMQREGIFREMKLRGHFEKPSEKKAREKAEAVRRTRKLARKKLQREGLLPMPKKIEKPKRLEQVWRRWRFQVNQIWVTKAGFENPRFALACHDVY